MGARAYGTTPGVLSLLGAGGGFIVRTSLQQIRLAGAEGGSASLIAWLASLGDASPGEHSVSVASGERSWQLRLVALKKSPQAAEAAREKARRDSARKGHRLREETLTLADYVVVLSNCGAGVTALQILETYRFRWQIELALKRLKSLLFLDNLRARDSNLAQTYLLSKLLGALLAEELIERAGSFSPGATYSQRRPVSPWRIQRLCYDVLRSALVRPATVSRCVESLWQVAPASPKRPGGASSTSPTSSPLQANCSYRLARAYRRFDLTRRHGPHPRSSTRASSSRRSATRQER